MNGEVNGLDPRALCREPNALARHYSRFRVTERLLLTGHSHQAWPDAGFEGQKRAWWDAAEHVDGKWEQAFAAADRVRRGYRRLLGEDDEGSPGHVALAGSTHDLLVRFVSALPLRERPRLVTTDGEFHSARRQLDRLAEEGIEVVRVAAHPAAEAGARVAAAVDDRTAATLVSAVFFETGHIAGALDEAMRACRRAGAELLVDAYHALNVVPFSLREWGLEDAWVVGGGYKYCQLGEGNAFLRFPRDRRPRPVVTGWFGEFGALEGPEGDGGPRREPGPGGARGPGHGEGPRGGGGRPGPPRVRYGDGPERFAGATYDPTSHYRAAAVFEFFEERGLDAAFLREVSLHQVGLLAERFDALDADPALIDRDRSVPPEGVGGFLALRSPRAGELRRRLRERGVHADYRDDVLRLGPAPYLSDRQLEDAVAALGEALGGATGAAP